MVASERLGVPMEQITVLYGDTDTAPPGGVTGGSRSAQTCGVAVGRVSEELVRLAKERAAALLEAAVEDIEFDDATGRFFVAGAPAIAKSWIDVARESDEPLAGEAAFEAAGSTFPFGTNIMVVEVDTETGQVQVVRCVACDDAGEILNPLLVEGQIHGGLAMGIAQALMEEIAFDADGNPLTSTLADYAAVSAPELPDVRARRVGHAHADERARREGHRRVGHDRQHAGGGERGARRADPPRRRPPRHAGDAPTRVGGDQRGTPDTRRELTAGPSH